LKYYFLRRRFEHLIEKKLILLSDKEICGTNCEQVFPSYFC